MLPDFPKIRTVKVSDPDFRKTNRYKKERPRIIHRTIYRSFASEHRSKKKPTYTHKRSAKTPASTSKLVRFPVTHVVLRKQEPFWDEDLSVSSEKEMTMPGPYQRMANVMNLTQIKKFFTNEP